MLEEFDIIEKKGFDEYDVQEAIKTQVPNDNAEFSFEMLAWKLVFSNEVNKWGTHYGPIFIGNNNGETFEIPSRDEITSDALQYWYKRYEMVQNPLLKVRYCGLVWDFYYLLPDKRKPFDLYEQYTNALLDVVRGEYLKHKVIGKEYLQYIKELVFRNSSKCNEWKLVLQNYVSQEEIDSTSIGIWCAELDIINNSRNIFTEEERQASIYQVQKRYNHFSNTDNIYLLKDITDLMYEYYVRYGDKAKAHDLLYDFESILKKNTSLNVLQKEVFYELLLGKYRQLGGYTEDENRMMKYIHVAAADSIHQMQQFEMPIDLTPEQIDGWLTMMTEGEPQIQIERFLLRFLPSISKEREDLDRMVRQHPLYYLVPTKLFTDYMPSSVIMPYDQDQEGHLMLHLTRTIQLNDIFMNLLLRKLSKNGVLSSDVLNEQINNSGLVSEDRKHLLSNIMNLFFDRNYVAFCHQVVPQIEKMIRVLLQKSGINILKSQRDGNGFQLRTLDDLLREPIIDTVFRCEEDKSMSTYLRFILTDQRGYNYRNLICHGMINPSLLNENVAGRLLHILMLLLRVQEILDINNSPTSLASPSSTSRICGG